MDHYGPAVYKHQYAFKSGSRAYEKALYFILICGAALNKVHCWLIYNREGWEGEVPIELPCPGTSPPPAWNPLI